jgi:PAS domain S-box-containing protein
MTQQGPETHYIERMLRLLAEQAQEHAIFLMDSTGRIVWYSKGAQRLFSLDQGQVIGEKLDVIFTPDDRERGIAELERTIAHSDAVAEDDRWHMRSDGSRFWSSGAQVMLRDDRGQVVGFGKILRDRTDIKEQLESLRNSLAETQVRNERMDAAITRISHELRNVYAGIHMGIRLIGRNADDPSRVASLMQEQLQIVERLTEDLIDAKRLSSNKVSLTLRDVLVQELLQEVCAQLEERCREKSLQLQLLSPAAPIRVNADEVRLHQIFTNLLDNAIKYTPPGGRIWIKATLEDRDAVIHVEDTGRGIPPEMLTHIFELFTQVDPETSGGGLGVGLALVHELVRLHDGSIQATSKGPGMGSEFSVRLPLADPGT